MDYKSIIEYLEGKIPEEKISIIKDWLKNEKNANESRQILGEIWANNDIKLHGNKPDFDRLLDNLHHKINSSGLSNRTGDKGQKNILKIYHYFSRIAAILIIPLIFISVFFYLNRSPIKQYASVQEREIYTKPGTNTKIELSDGTNVWLNNGTTFKYPEVFNGDKREVYVDGEAYFEVVSNPKKPFVVHNPMMNTIVTGTKFNLNAYSLDHYFEATLLEGKVELERKNQKVKLNPGEQIQFDAQKEEIICKKVNPEIASAWINGKLIFKDEQLATAIKKLSRWYNVEIVITDYDINNYLLTATLEDEKLSQTLDLISLAIPVKYSIEKNKGDLIKQKIYLMKK